MKEILLSLITHLHAFAMDVRLTEGEWEKGIRFLTETGQKCDDKRQEFILLSDVLGLSMLTVSMGEDKPQECTDSTVFGPFFVDGAPEIKIGDDMANGAKGIPCQVSGHVKCVFGEPIPGASIDVWQADADGKYDVQYAELDHAQARGRLVSGERGQFSFRSILPEAYPIPVDGPVGQLLEASKNHPWRPAHLHFMVKAPGYKTLITHLFRKGDRYLDSDPVFGVRESLIVEWVRGADGGYTLEYDFVLSPEASA